MNNMDLNELELYELLVDADEDGVFAVSAVSSPAIERGFIYMNKQEINLQSVSDEKRLVAGPLLIPNKKILRVSEDGIPYSIFFSPETIETIARKFMKNRYNGEVTVEHDRKVEDVYLTENWIIDESKKDKSNQYGFTLPKGTWFAIYKVENDKVWEQIKSGELKGFSVEALLEHKVSKVNPKQLFSDNTLELSIDDLTEEQAKEILNQIHKMLMPTTNLMEVKCASCGHTYNMEDGGSDPYTCHMCGNDIRVELESYSDYGQEIRNNAKRGIELNDKVNNKCATQVGKVRAQQLADGEPISLETIKRMYSYLSRAETFYDESDTEACGTISYLLWGGKSALSWSRNKLEELGQLELEGVNPSIPASTYPGEISKTKKDESK